MATAQNKVFTEKPAGFYKYGGIIYWAVFLPLLLLQSLHRQQML